MSNLLYQLPSRPSILFAPSNLSTIQRWPWHSLEDQASEALGDCHIQTLHRSRVLRSNARSKWYNKQAPLEKIKHILKKNMHLWLCERKISKYVVIMMDFNMFSMDSQRHHDQIWPRNPDIPTTEKVEIKNARSNVQFVSLWEYSWYSHECLDPLGFGQIQPQWWLWCWWRITNISKQLVASCCNKGFYSWMHKTMQRSF